MFGTLWRENPDTLKSYYNKAMNQAKSLDFQDELKKNITLIVSQLDKSVPVTRTYYVAGIFL